MGGALQWDVEERRLDFPSSGLKTEYLPQLESIVDARPFVPPP